MTDHSARVARLERHLHLLDACARTAIAASEAERDVVRELIGLLAQAYEGACALVITCNPGEPLDRRALAAKDAAFAARVEACVDKLRAAPPTPEGLGTLTQALLVSSLATSSLEPLERQVPLLANLARETSAQGMIAVPLGPGAPSTALVLLRLSPAEEPLDDQDVVVVRSVAAHAAPEILHAAPNPHLLRKAIDALPAMVAYWDAGLVCRFANKAYRTWFGVDPHALLGRDMPTFLGPLFELNRPFVEGALRGVPQEFERTIPDPKGGSARHSHALYIPDVDVAGCVRGFSVLVVDISRRKQDEMALALAKDAADGANRELESFSYAIAHDLRAPLRAISGFGALLADSLPADLDPEAADWLRRIRESAHWMGRLIDALLFLSGVTRRELKRTRVDLSQLVRESAARLAQATPTRAVELVVTDALCADVDATLAAVLVDNLVSNAWKFSSSNERARIEFGVTERDGVEMFYVRDNGVGFDAAHAAQLFTPFRRLHPAHEFPGTGVGLATVERIIRVHGGEIAGSAVVNEGATFLFSLGHPPIRTTVTA